MPTDLVSLAARWPRASRRAARNERTVGRARVPPEATRAARSGGPRRGGARGGAEPTLRPVPEPTLRPVPERPGASLRAGGTSRGGGGIESAPGLGLASREMAPSEPEGSEERAHRRPSVGATRSDARSAERRAESGGCPRGGRALPQASLEPCEQAGRPGAASNQRPDSVSLAARWPRASRRAARNERTVGRARGPPEATRAARSVGPSRGGARGGAEPTLRPVQSHPQASSRAPRGVPASRRDVPGRRRISARTRSR